MANQKTIKITEIKVNSILNKHKKRDPWFLDDYSVNPYISCPYNCVYCYIRGSKYGTNLARSFAAKTNAPEILEKQLSRRAKKGEYGIIALATATDPYPPVETKLKITRRILEIILKYRFPVHILTKSPLATRDIDLIKKIDKAAILPADLKGKLKRGAIVNFSFSTLDPELAKIFEPLAPTPEARLNALKQCSSAGLMAGASFIPVLPHLSDSEKQLEQMIKTAKAYKAQFVFVGALTLFGNKPGFSKYMYYKVLEKRFPDLVPKYKSLYRIFPMPSTEYQKKLERKAEKICKRLGIKYKII